MRGSMKVAPIIGVVVLLAVMLSTEAETYTVGGDDSGWQRSSDPSFYSKWASGYTFHVNDVLEFKFKAPSHTVALVRNKLDYDGCNFTSPITTWETGPALVTLNSTGLFYFVCTISDHCFVGQKMAINVTASSGTNIPSSSTPSPPPPKSNSAAPTSLAAAAVTFVIFGLVYVVGLLN